MKQKLGRKFWSSMIIFGLIGQVAWVVENMYFNVFIYKMFHATAAQISLMVSASSVAATVTTILIGALSDKLGKRKLLICMGYNAWITDCGDETNRGKIEGFNSMLCSSWLLLS